MTAQANYTTLETIPSLSQVRYKIKNKERVERILNGLIEDGVHRLQVISDFDHTITKKVTDDGKTVSESFKIVISCQSISNDYGKKLRIIRESHLKNKQGTTVSEDERVKRSTEFFYKMLELLNGYPLTEEEIEKNAYESNTSFRNEMGRFFHTLYNHSIPLLLLSAGIGNSIVTCLKKENLLLPNVTIISNFLKFKDGVIDGCHEEIVPPHGKNRSIARVRKYYETIPDRDNIIVIGDLIYDSAMASGIATAKNVLKIGFLSDDLESIDEYMEAFDIVVISDNTMKVPQAIIDLIINNN